MEMKNRKLAAEIAEERMSMIAPLLSQNMDSRRVEQLRQEICERNQISQRTLERYLCAYLNGGFEALKPQSRSSQSNYKIPQELLDEAIQLRRELPSRSIPTIIKILELEKKAPPGFLKRTTLQDALSRAGYSTAMMKLYNDKGYASQRFQRLHRHDLWQGDIKYGLVLNLGGVQTQTYFSCLIDDATRYILHGEFYGTMEQGIVEDTLQKAMLKFGLCIDQPDTKQIAGALHPACSVLRPIVKIESPWKPKFQHGYMNVTTPNRIVLLAQRQKLHLSPIPCLHDLWTRL